MVTITPGSGQSLSSQAQYGDPPGKTWLCRRSPGLRLFKHTQTREQRMRTRLVQAAGGTTRESLYCITLLLDRGRWTGSLHCRKQYRLEVNGGRGGRHCQKQPPTQRRNCAPLVGRRQLPSGSSWCSVWASPQSPSAREPVRILLRRLLLLHHHLPSAGNCVHMYSTL